MILILIPTIKGFNGSLKYALKNDSFIKIQFVHHNILIKNLLE